MAFAARRSTRNVWRGGKQICVHQLLLLLLFGRRYYSPADGIRHLLSVPSLTLASASSESAGTEQ